jgi:hypothetical protein
MINKHQPMARIELSHSFSNAIKQRARQFFSSLLLMPRI